MMILWFPQDYIIFANQQDYIIFANQLIIITIIKIIIFLDFMVK